MAAPIYAFASLVKDTATGTSGDLTLSGSPATGYVGFNAAFGTNVYFPYVARQQSSANWEEGWAYLSTSTNLVRAAAYVTAGSSGAGTLLTFSGTIDVYCAAHTAMLDDLPTLGQAIAVSLGMALP